MKTYLISTYEILVSFGLTPLETIYRDMTGAVIYAALGTVPHIGTLRYITVYQAMPSNGILLFQSNLNATDLA